VALGQDGGVYADPYTGEIVGEQSQSVQSFFRVVTVWHRWLGVSAGASGEGHAISQATARTITGACNLAFLLLVMSGFYLWWPRVWKWNSFRAVLWFRGGLSDKARNFNWHNVAGFWCCVPLFFIVASGVVMSYPWASNLVYRAAGSQPPAQGERRGGAGAPREASFSGLDELWSRAEEQASAKVPGWKTINLRLPTSNRAPLAFTIDASFGGQPQKRATLTLNRQTGEIERWEPFESQDTGRRARTWFRFVHTGEYYGLTGQTVAGIASTGGALLVWTGLSLALRRLRTRLARKASRAGQPIREAAHAGR
jgi:uncharacterized iron-regulated membrane protein